MMGRRSNFKYAWLVDELKNERDRGITLDVKVRNFTADGRNYTIIDTPGHREYTKKMIAGVQSADAAVLMVAANSNDFMFKSIAKS